MVFMMFLHASLVKSKGILFSPPKKMVDFINAKKTTGSSVDIERRVVWWMMINHPHSKKPCETGGATVRSQG